MSFRKDKIEYRTIPVLVIGSGAAGARTAISMKNNGITPLVVSKRDYGDAHTTWARGGINAALGNRDPEDSWQIHAADTLKEGHFINNPDAVEVVTKNMPDIAEELHSWGMDFTETEDNKLQQRYFGAQSYRRTCFAGDYTGEALMNTLISKAQELEIPYMDGIYITKLVSDGDRCYGAVGYNTEEGNMVVFKSQFTVLAAGGHTAVYDRHSSRREENTGDGIGLAYEAGAELMDMEFVQFHPTGMVGDRYGKKWDGKLVTEAVRGEGGRLYNSNNERFMEKYSPEQMELDARDVVARSIEQEIREGRGTDNGGVYLDITHRDEEFIKNRLPRMYERFRSLGVNISEEPMEVAPTAHYAMGGVKFDPKNGKTSVDGLRVAGESTAGVHGANRLGGNSLAETVTIGREIGRSISDKNPENPNYDDSIFEEFIEKEIDRMNNLLENSGKYSPDDILNTVGFVMEDFCRIRRDKYKLKRGINGIRNARRMYKDIQSPEDIQVTDVKFEMMNNIRFMLVAAEATLKGALERRESRGAHYRTDFPNKSSSCKYNITYYDSNGNMHLDKSDVGDMGESVKKAVEENHQLDYHHLE